MIRKTTYLYLLLSATLVGCNDEFDQRNKLLSDKGITFDTYVGSSRASAVDVAALQSSADGFGVMAYHTGEDAYVSATKPNYMNNQRVVYKDGSWNYSPLKYWPSSADEKISFFAYAPYVGAPVSLDATESGITALPSLSAVGDPVIRYEFGSDISKHIDLLYASAKNKTNTSDAVNFEFKHALSRIGFKVCGWKDDGSGVDFDNNTTVTINAVTMSTTRHGASLNITNGEWSEAIDGDVHAFTLSGAILQNNIIRPGDSVKRINTDEGYIMIAPDNFITDAASKRYCVLVDYTVETIDPNLAGGKLVTRNKVYRYLSPNFEPGKAYTINIHLGMTDNAGADDGIGDGPDPVDPNPDDPTELSTGGKNSYVRFSATVTDWEDAKDIHTIPPKISKFNATYDTFNISCECKYEDEELPVLTLKSIIAEDSNDNALRSDLVVSGPNFNISDKDLNYAYIQTGKPHIIHAVDKYGQKWETTVTPEFGMMEFTLSITSAGTNYRLPFDHKDDSYSASVLAVWDDEDQSDVITKITYENKLHTYQKTGLKKVRVLSSSTDSQNPQIGSFGVASYGGAETTRLYYSFDTPILKTVQPYFYGSFQGCRGVVSICEDLFKNFPDVRVFPYTFANCAALKSIPEGLFKYTNDVTSFEHTFDGCTSLTSIPESLFANTIKAVDFIATFKGCSKLTSIPEDLFVNNVYCSGFGSVFSGCKLLTSISENIFASNSKVEYFNSAFEGCSALTSIPENIFKHNTLAYNFNSVFDGCSKVTEIPENLFRENTEAELFNGAFASTKIQDIPSSLFSNCRKATGFSRTFSSCTSLRNVPEGILQNCPLAQDCSKMFMGCSNLKQIPSDIFASNDKIDNVAQLFSDCSSLTAIPATLFKTCPEITDFSRCFMKCTTLNSLPEGLFDACAKASNFMNAFWGCTNLKEVPTSLFDHNFPMASYSTNSAEGLFSGCTGITSQVPELWNRSDIRYYSNAYRSCTSAANYSSIPSSWK